MNEMSKIQRQITIDDIAANFKPSEMREMAGSLLRLADSLDQAWDDTTTRPMFRWPNALSRVERNALNLGLKAQTIYRQRRNRRKFVSPQLLGEPAWDMLLELFMQFAGGAKVSTTSLCLAADVPSTTALRHITLLEEDGLIKRSASQYDKRVTFVELTDKGVLALGKYLEDH